MFSLFFICLNHPDISTHDPPAPRPLRLFPKPTRGEFYVALPGGWRGSFQLELFDATGRRVWSREEHAAGPVLTTNLPEGLPGSMYFLKLRDAEGQVATGKVLLHR